MLTLSVSLGSSVHKVEPFAPVSQMSSQNKGQTRKEVILIAIAIASLALIILVLVRVAGGNNSPLAVVFSSQMAVASTLIVATTLMVIYFAGIRVIKLNNKSRAKDLEITCLRGEIESSKSQISALKTTKDSVEKENTHLKKKLEDYRAFKAEMAQRSEVICKLERELSIKQPPSVILRSVKPVSIK